MLSKDDALAQVMAQNQFLKQFSMVNDINDHLVIHDVKSIKSNDKVFQAFASVSNTLREGFRCHKDKVTIGMLVCKIYDRQSIKRCNNCQGLGHYYKECKSPSTPICAKCSGNHRTDTCTSDKKVCINCSRSGKSPIDHTAFDPKCPSIISFTKPNLN